MCPGSMIEIDGAVNRSRAGRGEWEKNAAEGAPGTHRSTHRSSPPSGGGGEAGAEVLGYLTETATSGSMADRRRAVNPWVGLFRREWNWLPEKVGETKRKKRESRKSKQMFD
jgi:hypothetical protein